MNLNSVVTWGAGVGRVALVVSVKCYFFKKYSDAIIILIFIHCTVITNNFLQVPKFFSSCMAGVDLVSLIRQFCVLLGILKNIKEYYRFLGLSIQEPVIWLNYRIYCPCKTLADHGWNLTSLSLRPPHFLSWAAFLLPSLFSTSTLSPKSWFE